MWDFTHPWGLPYENEKYLNNSSLRRLSDQTNSHKELKLRGLEKQSIPEKHHLRHEVWSFGNGESDPWKWEKRWDMAMFNKW